MLYSGPRVAYFDAHVLLLIRPGCLPLVIGCYIFEGNILTSIKMLSLPRFASLQLVIPCHESLGSNMRHRFTQRGCTVYS